MDAHHFLTLANLLNTIDQPAYQRTSINRSYYGAHGVAVELLESLGWTVSRESYGHDEVQALLKLTGDQALMEASAALRDLYTRRIKADYRLEDGFAEEQGNGRSSLSAAVALATTVQAMRVDPKRSTMISALAATGIARALVAIGGHSDLLRWRPRRKRTTAIAAFT